MKLTIFSQEEKQIEVSQQAYNIKNGFLKFALKYFFKLCLKNIQGEQYQRETCIFRN